VLGASVRDCRRVNLLSHDSLNSSRLSKRDIVSRVISNKYGNSQQSKPQHRPTKGEKTIRISRSFRNERRNPK
jgi:hypothetical protein